MWEELDVWIGDLLGMIGVSPDSAKTVACKTGTCTNTVGNDCGCGGSCTATGDVCEGTGNPCPM